MTEDTLPEDIMEDILSRMEPGPLSQIKSVSKGLNLLISSTHFMKQQLQKMKDLNRKFFILQTEFCFVPLFYDDLEPNPDINARLVSAQDKPVDVVASSNGLVLFCNLDDEFFLMNPITKNKHQLPMNKIEFSEGCKWAQVFYGMGYLNDEDDYKVIRIALFDSPDLQTEVKMYSRNSGSWAKCSAFPHDFPMAQSGVCVHGRLHWRSALYSNEYYTTYLNLSTCDYGTLPISEVSMMYGGQQLVALDDETLALSCTVLIHGTPYILWVLKNYFDHSSWTKISIRTSEVISSKTIINFQPLTLLKPDGIRILFRLDPVGIFGVYNLINKSFTLINTEYSHEGFCTVYGFVPCLHSPRPKE